jgi:hypothetical protein
MELPTKMADQPDAAPEALEGVVGRKNFPGIHAYQKPSIDVVALGALLSVNV